MAINQIGKFSKYFSLYFADLELYILTDPIRSPDFYVFDSFCNKNLKLIIRNYGLNIDFERLKFYKKNILATIDNNLAIKNKINGIHIPNKNIKNFRRANIKPLFITISAHNYSEIIKAIKFGADRILISPIFESQSKSAKKPIGIVKLAKITREFGNANFITLGGINRKNVKRLKNLRIKGVAGVSFKI